MTKRVGELKIDKLATATARLKLPKRVKPHWHKIATGIALGYRAGPGSWNVRWADGKGGNRIRIIGLADDRETANGDTVLNYEQAIDKARLVGRSDGAADIEPIGRSFSVDEALQEYKTNLIKRQASVANARHPRQHLPPHLLKKLVVLLTARELALWQSSLLNKRIQKSTINRVCTALKAALNHAARLDPRIKNAQAWMQGLSQFTANAPQEIDEYNILEPEQRAAIIRQAYAVNLDLGVFVELHDATGMRTSQIRLIAVRDLQGGAKPLLMVPSALKGRNRGGQQRRMIPIPISTDLAARLQLYAAGRKPGALMLHRPDGEPWGKNALSSGHRPIARRHHRGGRARPGVISMYAFRHTAIVRALKSARLNPQAVATTFDTSLAMIKQTYGKWIVHKVQDELRAALVDDEAIGGNVIPMRR